MRVRAGVNMPRAFATTTRKYQINANRAGGRGKGGRTVRIVPNHRPPHLGRSVYLLLAEGLRAPCQGGYETEHLECFNGREQGGGGREAVLGCGIPGALEGREGEAEMVGYAGADWHGLDTSIPREGRGGYR